jgi:DNA segregation ATPase FtsK/SpoIIIE-like protein
MAHFFALLWFLALTTIAGVAAFAPSVASFSGGVLAGVQRQTSARQRRASVGLHVAATKVTQAEADKVIQAAKAKLNGDKSVKNAVGTLEKVVSVVG